jgi:hypothetical protein
MDPFRTVYTTEVSVYTTSITESVTLTTLSDATETITAEEVRYPTRCEVLKTRLTQNSLPP